MTEPENDPPDPGLLRVIETIVAAYRWDAWRETAMTTSCRAARWSVVLAVVTTGLAVFTGMQLLPVAARISAFVYAPLVGWGVWSWVRSWLARRQLAGVIGEVRAVVVPNLATAIDDTRVLHLLTRGTALLVTQSVRIVAERRDAAVALVASEYDMSQYPSMFGQGDAGGG